MLVDLVWLDRLASTCVHPFMCPGQGGGVGLLTLFLFGLGKRELWSTQNVGVWWERGAVLIMERVSVWCLGLGLKVGRVEYFMFS